MKLYILCQSENVGYDTYDSAVVAAKSEDDARKIHASGDDDHWKHDWNHTWADKPEQVDVELIGTALRGTKRGVVLASFNAG